MPDSENPESVPTKTLIAIDNGLQTTNDLVLKAYGPISALGVQIVKLEGYTDTTLNCLNTLSKVVTNLKRLLQVLKNICRYIPEVGTEISVAIRTIESLPFLSTAKQVIDDIKKTVLKAKNTIIKRVTEGNGFVKSRVDLLKGNLPPWISTTITLVKVFHIVDFVVLVLLKDQITFHFQDAFGPIKTAISTLTDTATEINSFCDDASKTFQNNIIRPLETSLSPVLDAVNSVERDLGSLLGALGPVMSVLDALLSPFKPLFDFLDWIFDHTIKQLTDLLSNSLGIKDKTKEFTDTILHELRIDELESYVSKVMGEPLETFATSITGFLETVDIKDMEANISKATQLYAEYRKDPVDALFNVTTKVLQIPAKPGPFKQPEDMLLLALPQSEGSGLPSTFTINVGEIQQEMDEFVSKSWSSTEVDPKVSAVNLSYASYQNQPVSIVMRAFHPRVLSVLNDVDFNQKALPGNVGGIHPIQNTEFAENTTAFNGAIMANAVPSGMFQGLDAYVAKYNVLASETQASQVQLDSMRSSAENIDKITIRYQKGAVEFLGQFDALLNGLDPIFGATTGVLKLPLQYQTALTTLTQKAGLPQKVMDVVLAVIFETIANVTKSIQEVQGLKDGILVDSKSMSNAYSGLHDHVEKIFNASRFANMHNLGVGSFVMLVITLKQWLTRLGNGFAFFKSLGDAMLQDGKGDPKGGENDLLSIDARLAKLVPIIDGSIEAAKSLAVHVNQLSTQMNAALADIDRAFDVANVVSKQCRAVETHLIAADKVKNLCVRIETSIGPFQGLLEQLNVSSDLPDITSSDKFVSGEGIPAILQGVLHALSEVVCSSLKDLLARYFNLDSIKTELSAAASNIAAPAASSLEALDTCLHELDLLCTPNKVLIPYSTFASKELIVLASLSSNPLLDSKTTRDLQDMIAGMSENSHDIGPTQTSQVAQLLKMPEGGIASEKLIKGASLITWGDAWDAVQPTYPSHVFINWYSLLEGLEILMQRRQTRLHNVSNTQRNPDALDLEQKLREFMTATTEEYHKTIFETLRQPLHQRIDLLLSGQLELSDGAAAKNDILKQLPDAAGAEQSSAYAVPSKAIDVIKSMFPNHQISGTLADVLLDQAAFGNIAVDLRPLLAAFGKILPTSNFSKDASLETLGRIHDDYNFVMAKCVLEIGGTVEVTKELIRLTGTHFPE